MQIAILDFLKMGLSNRESSFLEGSSPKFTVVNLRYILKWLAADRIRQLFWFLLNLINDRLLISKNDRLDLEFKLFIIIILKLRTFKVGHNLFYVGAKVVGSRSISAALAALQKRHGARAWICCEKKTSLFTGILLLDNCINEDDFYIVIF